jgi:hypothetical protein
MEKRPILTQFTLESYSISTEMHILDPSKTSRDTALALISFKQKIFHLKPTDKLKTLQIMSFTEEIFTKIQNLVNF